MLVLRDCDTANAPCELQVLMMQRSLSASFLPGAYVFPGGVVDDEDASPQCLNAIDGLDDRTASALLGLQSGGLRFWVAAVRECFEESGLLLAFDRSGFPLSVAATRDKGFAEHLARDRVELLAGNRTFGAILSTYGAAIYAHQIVPWSRWITPIGGTRRFDTRFFVTQCPTIAQPVGDGGSGDGGSGAEGSVDTAGILSADGREMSDLQWFTPAQAIADERVLLITPTTSALSLLQRCQSAGAAMTSARQRS
jgi:8-oxo-dGTP pyrophosphatase MutT (NUDIX family)